MRYGICAASIGEYAEPDRLVEAAQAAEAAGWEALLVWDHLAYAWGVPSADPWVVLAAAAQATTRLKLGTAVTPLPRRRSAVVAGTVATLDRLSGGRVIFGAGLGGVAVEFTTFGEPDGTSDRAAMLDEGLDVVTALWSGQLVRHAGRFYQVNGVTLAPLPMQRPRVPVWIGGTSAPARRRAARWDGWIINCDDEQGAMIVPPARHASAPDHAGSQPDNERHAPVRGSALGKNRLGSDRPRVLRSDACRAMSQSTCPPRATRVWKFSAMSRVKFSSGGWTCAACRS